MSEDAKFDQAAYDAFKQRQLTAAEQVESAKCSILFADLKETFDGLFSAEEAPKCDH